MTRRVEDVVESIKDETRPIPAPVWAGLALLVSASLFLSLRLLMVQRVSVADRAEVTAGPGTGAPPPARPVLDVPARGSAGGNGTAAPAGGATPSGRTGASGAGSATPAADEETFRAVVEGWRAAWVRKDLEAFLAYYAPTFTAGGKDLAAWREQKARVFAAPGAVEVKIRDLRVSSHEAIVVVTFTQDYRSGSYADRGTKSLYLLPRDGRWQIFMEEWRPEAAR